jgi:Domain of unknown function (DUF4397)
VTSSREKKPSDALEYVPRCRRETVISSNILKIAISCCVVMSAVACGGGGGGGSNDDTTRGSGAATGVRVLHGAIEGPPVQVRTSIEERTVEPEVFFSEKAVYQRLDKGTQTLQISERNSPGSVFSQHSVDIQDGQRLSLLLYNFPDSGAVRSLLIDDVKPELADSEGAVRIAHTVSRASAVSVSFKSDLLGVARGDEVQFGTVGEYLVGPAGTYQLVVKQTADDFTVVSQPFVMGARVVQTILVSGEVGFFVAATQYEDS